ncbi:NF-kappa-B-repressing factor [Triplophysa dalaica]|uniref:NF-kappa-B-repressing factor n=1 Tax=Triplophysa dalaica TaxID=1582913 RepID=UPI0024DFEF67|nr:NF-kappa-B-repressing factor [Triplophysa dalaica]
MISAQSPGLNDTIKPSWPCNIDEYRQLSESDKQWSARRQFIVKNISEYEGKAADKLVALSMVWVNHVFLGCRYDPQLKQKVLEMAEGISVGEMRSYELVPSAEAKKRPRSSEGSERPVTKMSVCRPRFEPVHFVIGESSGSGIAGTDEKENEKESRKNEELQKEPDHQIYNGSRDTGPSSSVASSEILRYGNERQADSQANRFDGNDATGRSGAWENKRRGLGFGQPERPSSSKTFTGVQNGPGRGASGLLPTPSLPTPILTPTMQEKQRLIFSVSRAIAVTLRDPPFTGGPETPIYNFILSRSIQACKTNPEYIYVNLKDIPPSDLPKNRKVPSEGYACELRCQGVYLATGYSGSKNGARDRASEQAVKLLMRPVEVRIVQRQYKRKNVNDMVVCQVSIPNPILPPTLRNPEDKVPPSTKGQYEPDRSKHWTQFVLMENAHDAICMLNNSAAFNRMKIDYTFNPIPNRNLWLCSVYLQDELLAQASGTKKTSKHSAAEEAVRVLRMHQAAHQQQQQHLFGENHSSEQSGSRFTQHDGKKTQLGQLVILENSDNAICIINDTAQFNKVLADYKFTVLPDHNWRCEVYLDGQFVAAGIGPKKTVKHVAAEEALATLRRTQAVVKSNLRMEGHADAISRNQIIAHSGEESTRQEIKEDNIGNQLLRKMGWTGGGLGRDGEGIAVPIKVKEQFTREGLGMDMNRPGKQLYKRDIDEIIRNYACSDRQDDLRFSNELNNDERKQIHQISQRYGLRSKSYGQGRQRFLMVSRRVQKDQLIGQLLQDGQVGRYELVKPQSFQ